MNKNEVDMDIFMICKKIDKKAFKNLPKEYFARNLRKTELEIWKNFHFLNMNIQKKNIIL